MMKERHARARARAAGGGVDLARSPHQGVRGHAVGAGKLVDEDVVHARLSHTGDVDLELRVDRLADRHATLGDPLDHLALHGNAEARRLHDREDVAGAERDVDGDLADLLDLDGLPREQDERRRPAERDLRHAVTRGAHDGLDQTGLGVDGHGGRGAGSRDHPGLDGSRRGADRGLAARHVVAAGIREEEPEMSAGGDRLGHDGDQQAGMPAGLQTERCPEVIQALLEFAPLLGDRASRQAAEPAGDEPHPDPRRVEVDGRDQAIGSHGGMIAQTVWRRSGRHGLTPTRPRSGGSGRPRGDACGSAC
jgi:hypothetical protein